MTTSAERHEACVSSQATEAHAGGLGSRRACAIVGGSRPSLYYRHKRDTQAILRQRIREIAETRVKWGYRRIHVLLRREGWDVNPKRVYRLYCQEGRNLRRKRPRRHVSVANRQVRPEVTRANECWAMDFGSDALLDGRRLRVLTVLGVFTRESLALYVGQNLREDEVASVLELLLLNRRAPRRICCDNGPKFVSKTVDKWAYEHGVELAFSRPGRPTDNGYIESFNGRFREECLNANWFLSLDDARRKIAAWQEDYKCVPSSHVPGLPDARKILQPSRANAQLGWLNGVPAAHLMPGPKNG